MIDGKQDEGIKFSDYFSASEPLQTDPVAPRAGAACAAGKEGFLRLAVTLPGSRRRGRSLRTRAAHRRARRHRRQGTPGGQLADDDRPLDVEGQAVDATRARTSSSGFASEAEAEAIRVFGRNLHDLLLAAPAGQRATMGLDPGIRTGVKVAVVDGTGKLLETATVYPHEPRKDWDGALKTLASLCARHRVS